MSWNTTSSTKQNSATKHRGGPLNNIYRLFTNINLELTDPSLVPKISTLFKFHGRKLAILDSPSGDHGSYFDNSGLNLSQDQYLRIPEILNTEESERIDTLIMQKQEIELTKKTLDFDEGNANRNIATNIPTSAILDEAITNAKILSVDWTKITGEPSEFTPAAHTHGDADITDLDWGKLDNVPETFAPSTHSHGDSDITDVDWGKLTNVPATFTPSDDSVTSAKIADGAIVNADINASAAIESTKLKDVRKYQKVEAYGNINMAAYGIEGNGHFEGIQMYGDVAAADNDSSGYWMRIVSKAAVGGEFAGLAHFADTLHSFRRDRNGMIIGKMQTYSDDYPLSDYRFVFGFSDQRTLPADSDTLISTTQHGFFIAFRSGVDTNFRLLHNDGGGTAMADDDSGRPFPTTSGGHLLEITLDNSLGIIWAIKHIVTGATYNSGTINTKIPSTSQKLYFYFGVQGNAKSILLRNAECKTGGH